MSSRRRPLETWKDLLSLSHTNGNHQQKAIRASKESGALLSRMSGLRTLDVHSGCVNSLQWSSSGQHILSGSDDHRLVVSEPYTGRVRTDFKTSHKANIFSAKFLPASSDLKIVSCSGDGSILFTDLERISETQNCLFNCHSSTTYEILTLPSDPNTFLSCGEDGTVRWFDLRVKEKCNISHCNNDILIRTEASTTSMSVNPVLPFYLAVGSSDSAVRVFDRRMMNNDSSHYKQCLNGMVAKFVANDVIGKRRRVTSVEYRPSDGAQILVSYSSDNIYIFDPMADDKTKAKRLCVGYPVPNEEGGKSGSSTANDPFESDGERPAASAASASAHRSPPAPPMKRLRLRGDWSDTGPNARPESANAASSSSDSAAAAAAATSSAEMHGQPDFRQRQREDEQDVGGNHAAAAGTAGNDAAANEDRSGGGGGNLMQRMTEALSRMLNDPSTRLAMRNINDRREVAATRIQRLQRHRRQQRQQQQQRQEEEQLPADESSTSPRPPPSTTTTAATAESLAVASTSGALASSSGLAVEEEEREIVSDDATETSEANEHDQVVAEEPEVDDEAAAAEDPVLQRSIDTLRNSISDMRQQFVEREGTEPIVRLRRSAHGPETDTVSMEPGAAVTATALVTASEPAAAAPVVVGSGGGGGGGDDNIAVPGLSLPPDDHVETSSVEQDPPTSASANAEQPEDGGNSNGNDVRVRSQPRRPTSPVVIRNLPGPSQVIGDQGNSGTNPATGQRQRRRGVSGPPTEPFHLCVQGGSGGGGGDVTTNCTCDVTGVKQLSEFEVDTTDDVTSDNEEEEDEGKEVKTKTKKGWRHVRQPPASGKFSGHRNARTMMKEASWWGDNHVLSGSDCGHLFGWSVESGELVLLLEADRHVVNCVQPHPHQPLIATSGIDYNIKLWAPTAQQSNFDPQVAKEVMQRNQVMLEETRDTITVPATLMIRMLASLNQIRRVGGVVPQQRQREAAAAAASGHQQPDGSARAAAADEQGEDEDDEAAATDEDIPEEEEGEEEEEDGHLA